MTADPTPTPSAIVECRQCGELFENPHRLLLHRRAQHADTMRKLSPRLKSAPVSLSPLEKIREGEQAIRTALLQLDEERDALQRRILELDNTAAKYRNFLA